VPHIHVYALSDCLYHTVKLYIAMSFKEKLSTVFVVQQSNNIEIIILCHMTSYIHICPLQSHGCILIEIIEEITYCTLLLFMLVSIHSNNIESDFVTLYAYSHTAYIILIILLIIYKHHAHEIK